MYQHNKNAMGDALRQRKARGLDLTIVVGGAHPMQGTDEEQRQQAAEHIAMKSEGKDGADEYLNKGHDMGPEAHTAATDGGLNEEREEEELGIAPEGTELGKNQDARSKAIGQATHQKELMVDSDIRRKVPEKIAQSMQEETANDVVSHMGGHGMVEDQLKKHGMMQNSLVSRHKMKK